MNGAGAEWRKKQLFENVCLICSKELQSFIYRLTRKDPFATEEIYQNTMVGALAGLDYLRDSSKMKSWLFSIAKAESKRYYAANQTKNCNHGNPAGNEEADPVNLMDFTKSIEDKEYGKDLFNRLSIEERQLYILHYYYGLALKEISEKFNANYSTVRSMHTRGMTKIRKYHQSQHI